MGADTGAHVCLPCALSSWLLSNPSPGRAEENKKSIEESGQIAAESIDNIDTVVSLGIEPQFCSRYENLLHGPFR